MHPSAVGSALGLNPNLFDVNVTKCSDINRSVHRSAGGPALGLNPNLFDVNVTKCSDINRPVLPNPVGSALVPNPTLFDINVTQRSDITPPAHTGLAATSLLAWSPHGSYLLAASPGGAFQLWETEHWTHASWRAGATGDLVGARWAPDSRVVLLAFSGSPVLSALYLVDQAPGLKAQLLPVDLPDFGGGAPSSSAGELLSVFGRDSLTPGVTM